jgi:NTE family protein
VELIEPTPEVAIDAREGIALCLSGGGYGLADVLPAPAAATGRPAALPTRLAKTPPQVQDRLINWGYAVSDAGMRRWMDVANDPPATFPCAGGVGQP